MPLSDLRLRHLSEYAIHLTAKSALQIVITPNLMIALFLGTVVMCVASAIASIVRLDSLRVDPAIVLTQ
jgi:putative ABC transport system permease protein